MAILNILSKAVVDRICGMIWTLTPVALVEYHFGNFPQELYYFYFAEWISG